MLSECGDIIALLIIVHLIKLIQSKTFYTEIYNAFKPFWYDLQLCVWKHTQRVLERHVKVLESASHRTSPPKQNQDIYYVFFFTNFRIIWQALKWVWIWMNGRLDPPLTEVSVQNFLQISSGMNWSGTIFWVGQWTGPSVIKPGHVLIKICC